MLTLDWQVSLEAVVRFGVVEDLLEGRVFEGCAVDVPGDPVIIKDWCSLVVSALNWLHVRV